MHDLFSILFKVACLLLVVGLFSPKFPIFWMPVKSRERVAMVYVPIVIVTLLLMWFTGTKSESSTPDQMANMPMNIVPLDSLRPEKEQKFIDLINKYADLYKKAPVGVDKSKVWRDRDAQIDADKLMGSKITDWVGTVKDIGNNNEGNGVIIIAVTNNLTVKTFADAFSDGQNGTLIPQDSSLYQSLIKLPKGSQVKFSGTLLKSADTKEADGMLKPTYIVKFTNLDPVQ